MDMRQFMCLVVGNVTLKDVKMLFWILPFKLSKQKGHKQNVELKQQEINKTNYCDCYCAFNWSM